MMLSDQDFREGGDAPPNPSPGDHPYIALHVQLAGHTRPVATAFFNHLEDQLVTASADKSVRFWGVDSGELLRALVVSAPVTAAAFLPPDPQVFAAASSSALLCLVSVLSGAVLRTLRFGSAVQALEFDAAGRCLLAGTGAGAVHVLDAARSGDLRPKFEVQLSSSEVSCIRLAPASGGRPPCLLVSSADSSVRVLDCVYGPAGLLEGLTERRSFAVAHSLMRVGCCYSLSGQGYLVSGSEDGDIRLCSLASEGLASLDGGEPRCLRHHGAPVLAVAVNLQDTLLASADACGRVTLWRRIDFSHLEGRAVFRRHGAGCK